MIPILSFATNMSKRLAIFFIFLGMAFAQDMPTKVLLRLYDECSQTDWMTCLKVKTIVGLEKFRNAKTVNLVDGVSLVDEHFVSEDGGYEITEKNLQESLPRNLDDRSQLLNQILLDKFLGLFSKFTLKWSLSNVSNAINEGRGKKKYSHLMMMPIMMIASFVPLALGTLAILAGKALIVGKMALLLVSIMGIKKLFSNGSDDDHQRAMKRISDFGMKMKADLMMAQRMAYKHQMPVEDQTAQM